MIEFVLLFNEAGILLKKLEFDLDNSKQRIVFSDPEDLVASFFSVMFTYFSDHFGKIQAIYTADRLILIRKVDWMFIAMVVDQIKLEGLSKRAAFAQEAELFFTNKRIEENCHFVLKDICSQCERYFSEHSGISVSIITAEPSFRTLINQINEGIKVKIPHLQHLMVHLNEKTKIIQEIYPELCD